MLDVTLYTVKFAVPVKYECDSIDLTYTFVKSKSFVTAKLTNWALEILTPVHEAVSSQYVLW